jgi:hypothetical protein
VSGQTTLGVIVPCRDEAAVIARKLANLALARWPEAAQPHRLVVVDDGSLDEGPEIAREACARLFDPRSVRAAVVQNTVRPGKAGAILTALRELAECGAPDLVVLTDADVVSEPEAIVELALAFERDPRLGLACAAQRFVADLAGDGSCRGADLGEPREAGGLYDAWTARVRALESRAGALFSVHGQLCAWRSSLGLAPSEGIAADDLDLMLQARCAGMRVARVGRARFLEVKTAPGARRDEQALRRARAYVQFLGHPRMAELAQCGGPLRRLQVAAYRRLPTAAPWLAPSAAAAAVLASYALGSVMLAAPAALVLAAMALSPPGRRLARLCATIAGAARRESREPLGERWETVRR